MKKKYEFSNRSNKLRLFLIILLERGVDIDVVVSHGTICFKNMTCINQKSAKFGVFFVKTLA